MPDGDSQCPKIVLDDWRDREVSLAGHYFLSSPTPLFLHVPHRLFQDLEFLESQIEKRRARPVGAPLVMHRDGWFRGEVMVSVDPQPQQPPEVRSFQNLFYSRVVVKPGFDAALRGMPRFYRDLRAARVGRISAMYFWYLNCPRCLVERGAQRIILLARSSKLLASDPCPFQASPGTPRRLALPCQV